ncbi:CDGP domain-containing protein [Mycobacterium sherrisii]|uniref:CDGP domain-containing protein n=1 Tax=Mycobacterium sherrisii TaxID=243061 RepID=A0A1E3SSY9_9MYCO|nr:hypothetical protein [Mycobacterium sherrisii]MCV7032222.1 hypothetical protein [Mycobacterium sherrisii]MEC4765513.1 hypothetical protein [Mycobacterium sherrisii]ODR05209.1 hypothetical protein BHQ21_14605 [Mycobacterium sherrisii]ORW74493.1 hypothetical protein AWC25_16075 [Mycobacterium sherrisii]
MMKLAWVAAAASLGAALTIGGLETAPKASAGCQAALLPGEWYCDKPIGPDGTWERCHQSPSYPVYGGKGVIEDITPPPDCYPIDPAQPVPLGQPPNHIDD